MTILHICSSYFDTPLYDLLFSKLENMGVINYVYVPKFHQNVEDSRRAVYVVEKKYSRISKFFYVGEQKHILKEIKLRVNLSIINIIHVHRILFGGYAAWALKRFLGIPYIVAVRNSDIYGFGRNSLVFKNHCLKIMLNAEKIIFMSKAYKDSVLKRYDNRKDYDVLLEKAAIIPNGIDDLFFNNKVLENEHRIPQGKRIVLSLFGSIEKNKNQITIIKACDLLKEKGFDVALNLAGKIVNRHIFDVIKEKKYVNYLGLINKEEIIKCLRDTDIFIMPSVHETFGLVYAEAMSQGVPVIYTRGQGFDGQFPEGEVGYSTDCFDVHEIVKHVEDILNDYRNISNRCIANAIKYSWDSVAAEYKKIYEEIC